MNILVADDEKNICESLKWLLGREGHQVETCNSGEEAVEIARTRNFDIAFLDVMMGGMSGIEALKEILGIQPALIVFMISGNADIATAVQATKLGAYDFMEKPLNPDKVILELKKIKEQSAIRDRMKELEKLVDLDHQMLGETVVMRELRKTIEQAAPSDGRILIYGENGSGKELVARDIHYKSLRKKGPFVQLNCAAFPKDLIESELFGYERGAFTGAARQKIGLIESAEGGTLLLDEVGDMSLETQAKLLRVLQENEFFRLGGTKPIKFNVRIISATNKDLLKEIEQERFREDLYFRLNVVPITVPPLKDRVQDIPILAKHFMRIYSVRNGKKEKEISPSAIAELMLYPWPGNIRELRNTIERLAIMNPSDIIEAADIQTALGDASVPEKEIVTKNVSLKQQMIDFEKRVLMDAHSKYKGNVSKIAQILDTDRANLHKKLKKYGIKD